MIRKVTENMSNLIKLGIFEDLELKYFELVVFCCLSELPCINVFAYFFIFVLNDMSNFIGTLRALRI